MTIRFSKGKDNRETLTCIRDDGTQTWSPVHNGVGARHDIIHYVVESTLGYAEAFYGLVSHGRDIESFGTKKGVPDVYPLEAIHAEHIVGLLQLELRTGIALGDEEFLTLLREGCTNQNIFPATSITLALLHRLRAACVDYIGRWDGLAEGESLEVVFPPSL